jgi:hypothetical protein
LLGLTGLIGWCLMLDIRRRTVVEEQLRGTQQQLSSPIASLSCWR